MPWLECHEPAITWGTRELLLQLGNRQVIIKGGRPCRIDQNTAAQVHQEYSDVLVDGLPASLPPSRSCDHEIELLPGQHKPPYRPVYKHSPAELLEAKTQIQGLLDRGYHQICVKEDDIEKTTFSTRYQV